MCQYKFLAVRLRPTVLWVIIRHVAPVSSWERTNHTRPQTQLTDRLLVLFLLPKQRWGPLWRWPGTRNSAVEDEGGAVGGGAHGSRNCLICLGVWGLVSESVNVCAVVSLWGGSFENSELLPWQMNPITAFCKIFFYSWVVWKEVFIFADSRSLA